MQELETSSTAQNENFKLTDIVAILLRHRRKILLITGLASFIWLIYLYLLPLLGINTIIRGHQQSSISLHFVEFPEETKLIYDYNGSSLVASKLRDVSFLEQHYKELLLNEELAAIVAADTKLQFENLHKNIELTEGRNVLTMAIPTTDNQKLVTNKYLELLSSQAIISVRNELRPLVSNKIERIIANPLIANTELMIAQKSTNLVLLLLTVEDKINSNDFPLIGPGKVQVDSKPVRTRLMYLLVGFVLFIIMGLATAFIAEYIRKVKLNEDEMAKLKAAWKRTK